MKISPSEMSIMMSAFVDEMEKIAGMPVAVRRGGGGTVGELLRKAHNKGKASARARALPPLASRKKMDLADYYDEFRPSRVVMMQQAKDRAESTLTVEGKAAKERLVAKLRGSR